MFLKEQLPLKTSRHFPQKIRIFPICTMLGKVWFLKRLLKTAFPPSEFWVWEAGMQWKGLFVLMTSEPPGKAQSGLNLLLSP